MKKFLLVAFIIGAVNASISQAQVAVGPNVQLSRSHSRDWMGEVAVVADDKNPKHLIACAVTQQDNLRWITAFASSDQGASWTPVMETKGVAPDIGDPACAMEPDGVAYIGGLATTNQPYEPFSFAFLIYKSTDYGQTWRRLPNIDATYQGLDRESLVVDNTNSEFRGMLYLTGDSHVDQLAGATNGRNGVAVWRLVSGTDRFDGPYKRQALPEHRIITVGNSVVLSDSTLVVQYVDFRLDSAGQLVDDSRPKGSVAVVTSNDGGQSISSEVKVGDYNSPGSGFGAKNIDPLTSLAADRGPGPFKDRLYSVWADAASGRSEIVLAYSTDKGRTWSAPRRISDDVVTSAFANKPNHFNPVVAVNRNAVVGVMWYDRRESPDDWGWTIRFRASLDGGETWSPSVRVSEKPNVFNQQTPWLTHAVSAGGGGVIFPGIFPGQTKGSPLKISISIDVRQMSAGDYCGMAADAAGIFHPVWIDNRTGFPQLWTTNITVAGTAARDGGGELANLQDISGRVAGEFTSSVYDQQSQTVTVKMRLRNVSADKLIGPVKLRIFNLSSSIGQPEITNTDNELKGDGAVLDFTSLMPKDGLKPKQASGDKTLIFHLVNATDFRKDGDMKFQLVQFDARVLGK